MSDKTKISDVLNEIESNVADMAISVIRRKPQAEREPSRFPLIVVGAAAFVLLTLLDLISAILVGGITNAFYGVLVFLIGVGSLSIAEVGYFFSYADKWQKILSVADICLSIGSTLLVGAIAAIVNGFAYFGRDLSGAKTTIEIGMLVLLVVIGVLHAVLFLIYLFVDAGVRRDQKHQQMKAEHKSRKQVIEMSKTETEDAVRMSQELLALIRSGRGGILRETVKNLTGEDLLGDLADGRIQPMRSYPAAVEQPQHRDGSRPDPQRGRGS